jgi:hypothetical protein
MPAKNNKKFTPTEQQQQAVETLRRMYEEARGPSNFATISQRNLTTRSLKTLNAALQQSTRGVPRWHPTKNASSLYLAACFAQAHGASEAINGPLRMVEYHTEQVRAWWKEFIEPHAAKHRKQAARKRPAAKDGPSVFTIAMKSDAPGLGFIAGERLEATATAAPKVWEIVALWRPDEEVAAVGRVLAVDDDTITLRLKDDREQSYNRVGLEFLGRINPEPVGRDDGLTDEQRATLKKLRAKLDRLGDEDDQIIRCSSRYSLEKQIYDIEHPVDLNGWGAWEEVNDE